MHWLIYRVGIQTLDVRWNSHRQDWREGQSKGNVTEAEHGRQMVSQGVEVRLC